MTSLSDELQEIYSKMYVPGDLGSLSFVCSSYTTAIIRAKMRRDPSNAIAFGFNKLACVYLEAGKYDMVIAAVMHGLDELPSELNRARLNCSLAQGYLGLGDRGLARVEIASALQAARKHKDKSLVELCEGLSELLKRK